MSSLDHARDARPRCGRSRRGRGKCRC
jgi:hypothetical protein